MDKEIILSPGELYFLGRLLQAKYIDYSYIAAMDDIGKDYSLFEKETQASLVSSGALMEDFSGNVEISSDVTNVLNPVFFGETEASIHDYIIGDKQEFNVMKFHFYDEAITMVTHKNGAFILKKVDLLEIRDIIEKLLPEEYSCEDNTIANVVSENVSRFIVFKNTTVGKSANGAGFVQQEGVFYRETNSQEYSSVSRETFEKIAYNIIKGA